MTLELRLPLDGGLEEYRLAGEPVAQGTYTPAASRLAFAAAHVVADPLGDNSPGQPAVIDWEHTLGFRRHLWSLGLSVAEAMDTAQRGMGLDWAATQELIRRSAAEAPDGRIAVGVGTDQLGQSSRPVILHWLGSMFDPALDGYWGSDSLDTAADVVVDLIVDNATKVDGIKVSLLDASREVALRNRLLEGVRLYNGDDFH